MLTVVDDEPLWLRERRAAAGDAFARLEPPYPDRTDLTRLDYSAFTAKAEARPVLRGDVPAGVVFSELDVAVRNHPELVRPHLFSLVPPEAGKFEALHGAAWAGGAFLHVPAGVELEAPLEIVWPAAPANATYAPHTLVVMEEAARAEVVQTVAAGDGESALVTAAVEAVVADGARLRFADIQDWGGGVVNLTARSGRLGRDAELEWVLGEFGGRISRTWTTCILDEIGGSARSHLLFFGSGRQQLDLALTMVHHGQRTNGEMVARGALKDTARAVYRGASDIKKGAKLSSSQQRENVLHLTGGVRSDAIPSLQIAEHELVAGHAATVGKVDEEQLFYLRSRGIPAPEARRLAVQGFFAPLLSGIPVEAVREALARLIDRKLDT